MNELALFAGIGGGILGGSLLGFRCACAVELNSYCAGVLIQRQNDGLLPPFPIWDDVRTFDGTSWRGIIEIVTGGFPCQDISVAGKGAGITGERSGLWKEMLRIIREVRPRFAFVENVPALTRRGLDTVLGDLAEIGYDAEWCVLGADDVEAPHERKRIWILAHAIGEHDDDTGYGAGSICGERSAATEIFGDILDSSVSGLEGEKPARSKRGKSGLSAKRCRWWEAEPDVGRVVDGCPLRVDRIKALGNAQVPAVAATAFRILMERSRA
jgi:DNA (cytosine-5)-methyltransferase 1